ncbi:MAG: hypothetical protein ABIN94_19080, partial [Ferruginibacter sp.]
FTTNIPIVDKRKTGIRNERISNINTGFQSVRTATKVGKAERCRCTHLPFASAIDMPLEF